MGPASAIVGAGFYLGSLYQTRYNFSDSAFAMAISRDKIDEWFGEKAKPNIPDRDSSQVEEIRIAARKLATVILANTPASSDQSVAIRKVRDAQANAFSAIAFKD